MSSLERHPLQNGSKYGTNGHHPDEDAEFFLARITGPTLASDLVRSYSTHNLQRAHGESNEPSSPNFVEAPESRRSKFARFVLISLCCILIASSVTALVIYAMHFKVARFVWPLGYYGGSAVLGLIALASCVGLAAGITHLTALRILFCFLMAGAALGCVVVIPVCLLFDPEDSSFDRRWRLSVVEEPSTVCAFEHEYRCTGWNTPCSYPAALGEAASARTREYQELRGELADGNGSSSNGTTPKPTANISHVSTNCPSCASTWQTLRDYHETCADALKHSFDEALDATVAVTAVVAVLSLVVMWLVWLTRKVYLTPPHRLM